MRAVLSLARLYFLGAMRRQAHLATLFLAVILLMLPSYINAFSLGLDAFERVAKDFGLTLIGYFGVGMGIVLASSSIPKDLETRSLYPILARPINRWQYILSHFLATAALLFLSFLFLGLALMVSISALTRTVEASLLIAVFSSYLQALIVASFCTAFSTVASPALAGTVGVFVFLIGSLPGAFIRFFLVEDRNNQFAAGAATMLKSIVPNLSIYSLKDPIVHELPFNHLYLVAITLYALVWVFCAIAGAGIMFGRRDL